MLRPSAAARTPWTAWVLLAAFGLAAAGCAAFETVTHQVARPVKYRLVGADADLRKNLERGLVQLRAEHYQAGIDSFNRALWDLERIANRKLRLEELAETHRALGDAYWGLRKREWAEEQWQLSQALADEARHGIANGSARASLERAKEAYALARFGEALGGLRGALVGLEDVTDGPARLRKLEEARCYLSFTYFALDRPERTREEVQRLWALDPAVTFCTQEAPPGIRRLISDVRRDSEARAR